MRTTIDIPDPMYLQLKMRAAREKTSVKLLILKGVEVTLNGEEPRRIPDRASFESIRSRNPGSLKPGLEGVYDYIPFP